MTGATAGGRFAYAMPNTTTHRLVRSMSHEERVQLSADYARLLTLLQMEKLFTAQLDGDLTLEEIGS